MYEGILGTVVQPAQVDRPQSCHMDVNREVPEFRTSTLEDHRQCDWKDLPSHFRAKFLFIKIESRNSSSKKVRLCKR